MSQTVLNTSMYFEAWNVWGFSMVLSKKADETEEMSIQTLPIQPRFVLRSYQILFHPLNPLSSHQQIIGGEVVGQDGARRPGVGAVGTEECGGFHR